MGSSSTTDDAKRALVRAWLVRARHDLEAARKLAAGHDPLLDTAIYHCQQAVEKTLKGFLVWHDQRFPKTHDIEVLLKLAMTFEPRLPSAIADPDRMTEYATAFRYPGDVAEPERVEFDRALRDAEVLHHLVIAVVPVETGPEASR